MTIDTDPPSSQAELKFHKDFESPTAAILQAPDGTCFRFDLATLAVFSSFFEDLKSLPTQPTASGEGHAIINLPSTTTDVLHFALSAVKGITRGHFPHHIKLSKDLCDSILQTADAYDLPVLFTSLLKLIECQSHIDPRTRLVVAILAHDKPAAIALSSRVLQPKYDSGYRDTLVRVLEAREPRALAHVLNHRDGWLEALDRFQRRACQSATRGHHNLFNKSCRLSEPPCPVFVQFDGDLEDFVVEEAQKVRESLLHDPKLLANVDFLIGGYTRCRVCRGRQQQIIFSAIATTLSAADYTLSLDSL